MTLGFAAGDSVLEKFFWLLRGCLRLFWFLFETVLVLVPGFFLFLRAGRQGVLQTVCLACFFEKRV